MELMLSFDVSAIDVVLLVAVLALFMLFVTQKRSKTAPKHQLDTNDQKELLVESKIEQKVASENHDTQSAKAFQECVHQFGYLKDMPKNTPIPDECFGCPNVMRCLFPNSPASSENKAS